MSTTQYLTDAATRHAVFLQRYAGGQSKEATAMLYRIRRDINARLSREPTVFQAERLGGVLADINAIAAVGFKDIELHQVAAAQEHVLAEARFSTALFDKAATIDFVRPTAETLTAAVMTSGMVAKTKANITLETALQQFGTKKSKEIARIISDGVVLGDSTPIISQKVGQVINTLQKRQLDTLVRTIVSHTSSVARDQVYHANSEIIDGYQWISTLDNKTTLVCGARDGKVYQEGVGPMPPAHWGCRSDTIPKVKPEFDMGSDLKGKRPSVGAKVKNGKAVINEKGIVEKKGKLVSSRTTYGGWLKKQPVAFVDEALGPERSKLFRAGKLSMDKFTDPTGRVYNLLQLQRMNPIAFIE